MKEINKYEKGIKECFKLSSEEMQRLYYIEEKLHFLNERACERDLTTEEEEEKEKLKQEAKKILNYSDAIVFNNDPRGYSLKLAPEVTEEAIARGFYILKDWGGYGILAPDFEEEKPTEDKDELKKERKFRLDTKEKEAIKDFWESDLDIEIDREEYILVLTTDAYYFNYKGFDATRHWNGKRGLNIYSHRKKESIIAVDCDDGFQSPEEAIEYIESLSQEEISKIYNREYEEQIEY